MTLRRAMACAVLVFGTLPTTTLAQPGDRYLDVKARVLDSLFPLDVEEKPYFRKVVLRFGDLDSQLTVVVYFGGRSELIRYTLADMNKGDLAKLISSMTEQNRDVKIEDIAAKVKVTVSRLPVKRDAVERALDELKKIRISPFLSHRVALDGSSQFEFWYDTWQESVHYTMSGPIGGTAQDRLVQWMIGFRNRLPDLVDASTQAPVGMQRN